MAEPRVSVLIASDRVADSLPDCLASLTAQTTAPSFEVIVASSSEPAPVAEAPFVLRWVEAPDRNPARRRNRAAHEARAGFLAFLDDDAAAEPGWMAAGVAALTRFGIAGGPDLGPSGAPYLERVSDLLLATPRIGSGVPAHERRPRAGAVRSPHDVALCNLFVRRDVFESLGG
ncbi:MAG TPA: glycosyltransferase, partial [Thermoanaerobaculia bacterium]